MDACHSPQNGLVCSVPMALWFLCRRFPKASNELRIKRRRPHIAGDFRG